MHKTIGSIRDDGSHPEAFARDFVPCGECGGNVDRCDFYLDEDGGDHCSEASRQEDIWTEELSRILRGGVSQ